MKKLSVVLATHNEEANIKDCLISVKSIADEIIIIDGSSIDKTREIAKSLGAKVFKVANFLMFHKNKQLALEKASGQWILQLDADERLTKKLQKEMLSVINQPKRHLGGEILRHLRGGGINGYYLPRKNYFLGKWLRKGGQYPDYVIRLVKRGEACFPCRTVHEQIKVNGEVAYLKNPLIHLSNPNLASYFRKANIYTYETALKLSKKTKNNIFLALNFLLIKPFYTFFTLFVRHKGFIDGWRGFLFAFLSSLHFPWAFIKYLKINS